MFSIRKVAYEEVIQRGRMLLSKSFNDEAGTGHIAIYAMDGLECMHIDAPLLWLLLCLLRNVIPRMLGSQYLCHQSRLSLHVSQEELLSEHIRLISLNIACYALWIELIRNIHNPR